MHDDTVHRWILNIRMRRSVTRLWAFKCWDGSVLGKVQYFIHSVSFKIKVQVGY